MTFTQWLRKVLGPRVQASRASRRGKSRQPSRRRSMPALELLEDRLAPASFVVSSLADSGDNTLRAAVDAANLPANAGNNMITFSGAAVGGTITLSSTDTTNPFQFGPTALVIVAGDNLTIQGDATLGVTIMGPGAGFNLRNFAVATGATLTLENVTVSGGNVQAGNGGSTELGGGGGTTIITVSGVISGSRFGITKSGTGTLILSGGNSYTGTTTVKAGVLGGSGTVAGAVKVSFGAALAPGSTVTAILNTGNVTLVSHSTFSVTLNGTAAGTDYDQLNVTGTVNLGRASLHINVNLLSTQVGDTFTIIQNDGSDAVVGTFAGLAEGATITTQGGATFTISYKGGDGNDVVLTRTA